MIDGDGEKKDSPEKELISIYNSLNIMKTYYTILS